MIWWMCLLNQKKLLHGTDETTAGKEFQSAITGAGANIFEGLANLLTIPVDYTFDTSFPNNQTIFVLSNNVITSVFKLDMYLNIICVTNVYVNNDYYTTVDDANKTYQQILYNFLNYPMYL